ncbi:hypothetical protein F5Y17DRAFT_465616 [Xylariaceae sp. FL0594]|nr:hypothetical protein F5Y17DRAFT_465616 [Xylariaceae sp. FL0594]
MRLSITSLLTSALAGGSVAHAAVAGAGAARGPLPLPARTVFQLDDSIPGSWFENIAIRHNGDLLVTMLNPSASIYHIKDPLSSSTSVSASVISLDPALANGTLGIYETRPDVFVVAAALYSAFVVPVPGSFALWEIDLVSGTTRLIAKMPEAVSLNGVTGIRGSSVVLVADYGLGLVWRVDVQTGAYEVAAKVPEMDPLPGAKLQLGVNGLKTRRARSGYYYDLYFSNSNRASIYRLAIDASGFQRPGARAELVARFEADNIDDFDIDDATGDFWACTNFQNTVVVAKARSAAAVGAVVVGSPTELTVAGDTALALGGETKWDRDIVYVVTGGAQGRPVNGTVTEPAKVVAVDRRGFR